MEQAAIQHPGNEYDIIIVGSGIGGGVLASDLYETNLKLGYKAKRILLLEKGDLVFHSHCLNTARPDQLANDRAQQNDTFFQLFKDDYKFESDPSCPSSWIGGPMYNLGGRSAAWGLFAPRIHDTVLRTHFHENVYRQLCSTYYNKAEHLMLLSSPKTERIHQYIMDRLNIDGLGAVENSKVQWEWGRIASQFDDGRNFDFAEGAYSTIDKILKIAMSKPTRDGVPIEHEYFKTVLSADVESLGFRQDKSVRAIHVRSASGGTTSIPVKPGASVVLCAGSVHSPAILMRSGVSWQTELRNNGGLRLTDHDIFHYECYFRYPNRRQRDECGAMKLQTYVDIGGGHIALANMSIDASSFLPRNSTPNDSLPKFIMLFILQHELVQDNDISLDRGSREPVLKMKRGKDPTPLQMNTMKTLIAASMNSLKYSAKLRFIGFEDCDVKREDIILEPLGLGGVAHELGTLPMKSKDNVPHCLNENLCMIPELANDLYVCDLSCFPYSPESNPTLTLAALSIRLSRHLLPRSEHDPVPPNAIKVVNHSEAKTKVWLTNYMPNEPGGATETELILQPGENKIWERSAGVAQCLFVFKLDQTDSNQGRFLADPIPLVVYPNRTNVILRDGVEVVDTNEQVPDE